MIYLAKQKQNLENETPREKFKRVAGFRAKKIIYYARNLRTIFKGSAYEIVEEDAQRLLEVLSEELDPVIEDLKKLSEGESVKTSKKELEDIF